MIDRYAGNPLATRLGLKPGMRVWFHDMPTAVRAAVAPDRIGVEELCCASDGIQAAYLFATVRSHLKRELGALRPLIASNGFIWVSRPNADRGDLDADGVTSAATLHGFVEQDRCAVGSDWTGVKLVVKNNPSAD